MATVKLQFHSKVLKRDSEVNILLPQSSSYTQNICQAPFPVLYLLHGLGDNHNAWLRNSSVERYVEALNLCVVMPSTDRGFYTDTGYGTRYFSYISEELPALLKTYFPISEKREDTFACGLSMGGYGALKLGFRQPERFAAVAAFSAAPMSRFMQEHWAVNGGEPDGELMRELRAIFGEEVKAEDDVFHLCVETAAAAQKPSVFLCCGESDFLFSLNLAMKAHLEKHAYDLVWQQEPDTGHVWSYWDKMLPVALEWFLRAKTGR